MIEIDAKLIRRHKIIPLSEDAVSVHVGICQEPSVHTLSFLSFLSQRERKQIIPTYMSISLLEDQIQRYLLEGSKQNQPAILSPLQLLMQDIILESYLKKCSDVHFEPQKKCILIRFRCQGQLIHVKQLDVDYLDSMASFLKTNAHLDPTERRIPQDGQLSFYCNRVRIHCRLSCLPSLHGESFVLRLLPESVQKDFTLSQLGISNFPLIRGIFDKSQGLWLVTGLIGSGKTTTYYSILSELCRRNKRVISLENPIEIPNKNFTQIELRQNFNSKEVLRHLLRQSADVIGIGEIRDSSLLNLAVNAAITGHCVLATLHASHLSIASKRLANLGYPQETQGSFLEGILFQRLVPIPCPHCVPNTHCEWCNGTRVLERKAQFEFV
ncbi:MAG: Flp pilus assembly complex ATPase component TadA [Puniceicoccales bacterium]|jgi:type II secretory ATPase GspE/PulE/Tfp pilus assembly ATPase PilB-like protein|nr:Flp pilus assembly complex ATPase component TadA [Puniceicoccales bacterium]